MAKKKRAQNRRLNLYILIPTVFIIGVALIFFLQLKRPSRTGDFHTITPTPSFIFPIHSQDSYAITLRKGWYERELTTTKHTYKGTSYYSKKILYENEDRDYIEVNINPPGGDFLPDEIWKAEISNKNRLKITNRMPCLGVRCGNGDNELLIYVDIVNGNKYKGHDYSIFVGNKWKQSSIETSVFTQILESVVFK